MRREAGWLITHATFGFAVGVVGLSLPLSAAQDVTFPLWWWALPAGSGAPGLAAFWPVRDLLDVLVVALMGVGWVAVVVGVGPALARLQAWPGRVLLAPPAGADLSLRVAQLTGTRAAALDAHAAELRRIERALHDGTQNRLVAVTVLLGAGRQALARGSADAGALSNGPGAAEQALAELRTVARGILPPVLADRGLTGALAGLAGDCGVPCRLDVQVPGRCAASVEATAYFVVAEALTNVGKHSGATASRSPCVVRVTGCCCGRRRRPGGRRREARLGPRRHPAAGREQYLRNQ